MEMSSKLEILGILIMLTAFPLGYIWQPLILISLIGAVVVGIIMKFVGDYEIMLFDEECEKKNREKLINENREHMKKMDM